MATISPVAGSFSSEGFISRSVSWTGAASADTVTPYEVPGASGGMASVQVGGVLGGATVTLSASNDGVNFMPVQDLTGNPLSFTGPGLADFTTAARYIQPTIAGGTGDAADVIVVLR